MTETTFDLNALTADFKQAIQSLYGIRLANVILYGSYARGDFHAESDVDLLIVLHGEEPDRVAEIKRVSPVTLKLGFRYDVHISATIVPESRYLESDYLFFCNVRREGIKL